MKASQRTSDLNVLDLIQTLTYLYVHSLGLLTLIYHALYCLLQAQVSNAFGITATSIFEQVARQPINATNAPGLDGPCQLLWGAESKRPFRK